MYLPKLGAPVGRNQLPVQEAAAGGSIHPAQGDVRTNCGPCINGRQFCRIFAGEIRSCRLVSDPSSPLGFDYQCISIPREIFKGFVPCFRRPIFGGDQIAVRG
jgi:hypothetical protein